MQTKLVGLGTNCQLNCKLKTSNFTDMIIAEYWRYWKYYIAETFPATYVSYHVMKLHDHSTKKKIINYSVSLKNALNYLLGVQPCYRRFRNR